MRYRDRPTIEVTQRVNCDVATAWRYVSDITLPLQSSPELQSVEWLDGADGVAVGARFLGRNRNAGMGDWETVSQVMEVDDQRRWVWSVIVNDEVSTTWGFEVEPTSDGTLIRQWGRLGPGFNGLTAAIAANPDKEARIIERRLTHWREVMAANLEWIRQQIER
ncbi:MAG: SRPBCC family protein [Mycobacterium sp.]